MENKKVSNFAKNASWIFIGRAFQLILTFVTTMLVTRYLGPTKYGTITYTFSYVSLFLPICTLGMNDIVVKELIDNKNDRNTTMGTIISLRFLSSLLSIGFIYLIVKIFTDNPIFPYIAFLQSLSLVFQIFDTIIYFYQSQLLAKKTGIILAVSYTLTAIFRIVGLLMGKDTSWFAFAVSLDYLVISILLLCFYFKDGNKLSFSIDVVKTLLSKSSHYIFSGIMVVIYSKADTIILGKMIDETNVGYYAAATTLCNAWPFVLTAIIDSANPIIVETFNIDKNEYYKKIKQLYAAVFYISLFVAIFVTILAPVIISILYGSKYELAVGPLRIVCWATIFSYLGVARTSWMQCEKKTKYEATLSLLGAIVNVILNIVLIKLYGIIGAAIALLLTQFLTNVVFVYLIKETRENAKLIVDAIILKDILK